MEAIAIPSHISRHRTSDMKVKKSKLKILRTLNLVLCIVTLHFVLCTLHSPKAYAEGVSLKIQPASLQLRGTIPSDIHAPFTIENTGTDPVELTMLFKRFRDSGDGSGKIVYSNTNLTTDKDPFFNNVQIVDSGLGVRTLTLGPKQKRSLELEVVALN